MKSIKPLKEKIKESVTLEEFPVEEKIRQNSYKKSLIQQDRQVKKFHELVRKNTGIYSTANVIDKNKWVINMF